ncbi:MAG: hypothetical protein EA378_07970 [Phycisphaerales bacterium]|nr:MAG: hypothetical protein EA378_07970 [Phycisphaerales bacterium]
MPRSSRTPDRTFRTLLVLGAAAFAVGCAQAEPMDQEEPRITSATLLGDHARPVEAIDLSEFPTPGFPEYPSLSPDGRFLVFSYAGDLWAARTDGRIATRLTVHAAHERRSAFSPDGSKIAFESDRDGSRNLYVAPIGEADGKLVMGPARRVTVSDQVQTLGGWDAEGSHLLYADRREPGVYRQTRLWRVPVEGGATERITDAFGGSPSAGDDGSITFFRGYWIPQRPAYRGPGSLNLWRLEPNGSFTQLTRHPGNDFDGHRLPDGSTVFISARDGQNNLYRLRAGATRDDAANLRQLTRFRPEAGEATIAHGVRDLSVSRDGATAAFVVWDTIYTLDLTRSGAEPQPMRVVVNADTDSLDTNRLNLSRRVEEAVLSPDGKAIAVIARGEVFVRATGDDRPTRRVTRTHARESSAVWSPDNKTLYFTSDESGMPAIHAATVILSRVDLGSGGAAPQTVRPTDDADEADATLTGEGELIDDGLSGRWAMVASGPGGAGLPDVLTFNMHLTVTRTGAEVSIEAPGVFSGAAEGITLDRESGQLSFTLPIEGVGEVAFELTLEGGQVTGEATGEAAGVYEISGDRVEPTLVPMVRIAQDDDAEGDRAPRARTRASVDHGERWAEALRFEVTEFITAEEGAFGALPSPDGRKLIYLRGRGDAVLVDLSDMSERVLFASWNAPEIIWAGDSRHVVLAISDLDFNRDILLLDTQAEGMGEGEGLAHAVNLTRHPDMDISPRLSADGKVLVFLSDRDGENWQYNVYRIYLDRELEGMRPYDLAKHFEDTAREMRRRKPIAEVDFDAEYESPEPFAFDADDAYLRIERMTSMPGSQGNLAITPAGDRIIFSARIGESLDLHSIDHRGRDRRVVRSGSVSNVDVSLDGSLVSFVQGGQAGSAAPTGGRATTYGIDAPVVINVPEEQRRKFQEAARVFGYNFYHPTMKGLDWDALSERYMRLAEGTRTSDAFNRVLNLLFGEVDGSHTGASGGDAYNAPSPANGYLGVETEPAPGGYRVTRVIPSSPADQRVSRLHVGDVILAVDDVRLAEDEQSTPNVDLHFALVGTRGQETLLEVRPGENNDVNGDANANGDDANGDRPTLRYVLIEPVAAGAMTTLRYQDEVRQRRAMVDELSNGRLGYLHIRGMNAPSVREFERDLFAAADGKDALIIDVRDNGGGFTTDILLASLTAPAHAYTIPRGADPDAVPTDAYPRDRRLIYGYTRPIAVVINENSFSNAEIFAHAIKTIGRGKIIGTQTFGGVISTGSHQLLDGGRIRMPFRGWYLPDGTDMENNGTVPDIDVPLIPDDEVAGRDPQLEAAVESLLGDLDR